VVGSLKENAAVGVEPTAKCTKNALLSTHLLIVIDSIDIYII
jgi:hypothetical protein